MSLDEHLAVHGPAPPLRGAGAGARATTPRR